MNYVNNWLREITLEQGATSCPLDLPDGEYRLTLANSATAATSWEIVDAVVAAGVATMTRAREGTTDNDWLEGSVIYCSITAETLEAMSGGGAGAAIVEMITSNPERTFFGSPSTAPQVIGQRLTQLTTSGIACEWRAYTDGLAVLRWARTVMPLFDWGTTVAPTSTLTLAPTDKACAARVGSGETAGFVTTIALPPLVQGELDDVLEHAPIPLVLSNWSDHPWTVKLDPASFWVAGGMVALIAEGLDRLGITATQEGTDNSVVSLVIPADTRAWINLSAFGGVEQEVNWLRYELAAKPIHFDE